MSTQPADLTALPTINFVILNLCKSWLWRKPIRGVFGSATPLRGRHRRSSRHV